MYGRIVGGNSAVKNTVNRNGGSDVLTAEVLYSWDNPFSFICRNAFTHWWYSLTLCVLCHCNPGLWMYLVKCRLKFYHMQQWWLPSMSCECMLNLCRAGSGIVGLSCMRERVVDTQVVPIIICIIAKTMWKLPKWGAINDCLARISAGSFWIEIPPDCWNHVLRFRSHHNNFAETPKIYCRGIVTPSHATTVMRYTARKTSDGHWWIFSFPIFITSQRIVLFFLTMQHANLCVLLCRLLKLGIFCSISSPLEHPSRGYQWLCQAIKCL